MMHKHTPPRRAVNRRPVARSLLACDVKRAPAPGVRWRAVATWRGEARMNRRDMMRVLGGALALPLLAGLPAERLDALGRAAHRRARARAGGVPGLGPPPAATGGASARGVTP